MHILTDDPTFLDRPGVRPPRGIDADSRSGIGVPVTLLAALLDQVDYPIYLVGPDARLLHANRSGLQAVTPMAPLRVDCGYLGACQPREHVALKSAISVAARAGTRRLRELGPPGRTVMAAVVPLSGDHVPCQPGRPAERTVMVLAGRSGVGESAAARWFAACHGLTGAEVRVLEALLAGESPKEIATQHGVAVSTVRTQLASVRAKTGATSLRALVRKVGLLPPMPPVLGLL